jgi:hypothetical protein
MEYLGDRLDLFEGLFIEDFAGAFGLDSTSSITFLPSDVSGTVTFTPEVTLVISPIPTGAEVRIYDLDATLPEFGTELAGVESLVGTSFSFSHSKAGDQILVQIFATGKLEYTETANLLSVSQTLSPTLEDDPFI